MHDVSFRLERGSFTVVTGRIGSGKTTLLQALLGLLPPDAGTVRWNGEPVADPASFFTPPQSAYTPQVPRLFSETLRDNILLGLPEDEVDLRGALHLAVMEPDIADMPDGLDSLVGPRGVRLSGGQVQRAAAARMFVRRPELLVFDDLSSALDVETEPPSGSGSSPNPTPPCLAVSHRRAALRRADQIGGGGQGPTPQGGPKQKEDLRLQAPDDITNRKGPDFVVRWFSCQPIEIAADVLRSHGTPYIRAFV